MNRRPRVLLIGRHFWPHGSIDSAAFLFQLAGALHRDEVYVEVVTPRYASSWSERFQIREMNVHRPVAAPRSDWSMGRYVRHLTNWLRHHGGSFDVMLVDAAREESLAAIEAARSLGCATIVRCAGWGSTRDTEWWQTNRATSRCRPIARTADFVVAKSAECQRSLIAAGFPPGKVVRIDHGFASGPVRTQALRRSARRALGAAHGDLHAEEDAPVVLCTSRMTRQGGANLLVRAAHHLVKRYPNLRLWFIGDGPYRDWMFQHLRSEGVRPSIAMPGSFCDSEELFLAADVFLQPDDEGLDYFLPAAISAELPVVVIDTASTRAVITGKAPPPMRGAVESGPAANARASSQESDDPAGLVQWVSASTSKLTRMGLVAALDDLPRARERAATLRRLLLRNRPQAATVAAYGDLIRRSVGRSSSIEAVS